MRPDARREIIGQRIRKRMSLRIPNPSPTALRKNISHIASRTVVGCCNRRNNTPVDTDIGKRNLIVCRNGIIIKPGSQAVQVRKIHILDDKSTVVGFYRSAIIFDKQKRVGKGNILCIQVGDSTVLNHCFSTRPAVFRVDNVIVRTENIDVLQRGVANIRLREDRIAGRTNQNILEMRAVLIIQCIIATVNEAMLRPGIPDIVVEHKSVAGHLR